MKDKEKVFPYPSPFPLSSLSLGNQSCNKILISLQANPAYLDDRICSMDPIFFIFFFFFHIHSCSLCLSHNTIHRFSKVVEIMRVEPCHGDAAVFGLQ
jgi:hypothetical protein